MNPGKVSNSILDRSVLRLIKSRNSRVAKPFIGADCGSIDINEQDKRILCSESCGIWPVYRAANNIYSCGGMPLAAHISVIMPRNFNEYNLKEQIRIINSQCGIFGMQISGGHTQINDMVKAPVVTVTGIGVTDSDEIVSSKNIRPGQHIVMTKWICIGVIRKLIDIKRDEMREKYTDYVIDKAYGSEEDMSVKYEAQLALKAGIRAMHDVAEGGIFAALWDMAQAGNVGLDIDFRSIPVKQEIIELCEMYDINPYKLESDGALLIAADDADTLINLLEKEGIKAAVIGRATDNNDKVINNLDEVRYLDTPQRDEIYRFL